MKSSAFSVINILSFLESNYASFRFTSRAAAASLIHLTFVKVSDKLRTDLIQLFLRLCGDETPTVRKSAAQNLVQLFKVAQSGDFSHQLTLLLEAFQNFSKDEQV